MTRWKEGGRISFSAYGTQAPPQTMEGGCYAFYGDGRVVYIGSSACLQQRLRAHLSKLIEEEDGSWTTPWGHFWTISFKVRSYRLYGEWAMRELWLLRRVRTSGNKLIRRAN